MSTSSPMYSSTNEIEASCRIVALSDKWRPVVPSKRGFRQVRFQARRILKPSQSYCVVPGSSFARSRASLMRSDRQSGVLPPLLSHTPLPAENGKTDSPVRILIRAARIVSASPSRHTRESSTSLCFRAARRDRAAALDCTEPRGKRPGLMPESVAPSRLIARLDIND